MTNVVVVGAGVSGLTSALLLSRDGGYNITIVAKHMPGDYDIEFASPFAGANVMPMATVDNGRWERRTWPELKRIASEVPEAGLHFQKVHILRRHKDLDKGGKGSSFDPIFDRDPWYRSIFEDHRELARDELPKGYDSGAEFTSVCINTVLYLPWLVGLCLKKGVVFKRASLSHIAQAKSMSHTGKAADVILNTTGLGSYKLGGVVDTTMAPARGQTVLVRNECHPMVAASGTDDEPTDALYIMQRAAGGGTILGGTYDIGNWESVPDPNIANRILKRVVALRPEIAGGRGVAGLDIIRHGVGLRPYRRDGVRIEQQRLDDDTWIVHNYGHSGWGYQGSYGCAERVVELVDDVRRQKGRQSKL